MHRIARTMALAAVAIFITGCSVIGSPEPSYAPETVPTPTMPTVFIGPATDLPPLDDEQLSALTAESVSAAVHTLTIHGYVAAVLGRDSRTIPQADWDYLSVLDVTVYGAVARVTVG